MVGFFGFSDARTYLIDVVQMLASIFFRCLPPSLGRGDVTIQMMNLRVQEMVMSGVTKFWHIDNHPTTQCLRKSLLFRVTASLTLMLYNLYKLTIANLLQFVTFLLCRCLLPFWESVLVTTRKTKAQGPGTVCIVRDCLAIRDSGLHIDIVPADPSSFGNCLFRYLYKSCHLTPLLVQMNLVHRPLSRCRPSLMFQRQVPIFGLCLYCDNDTKTYPLHY
jgi:hypothetical protein